MPSLFVARMLIGVKAKIPHYVFKRHVPGSLSALGESLANQVDNYVRKNRLGYYPAIEYFIENGNVEPYLLDAIDEVAKIAIIITQKEVIDILQPIFSSVSMETIQTSAYTMPTIRPDKPNALQELAEHYTPDTVKFELNVSLFQKQQPHPGFEALGKNMVYRWLRDAFDVLEITSARLLDDSQC